MHVDDFIMRTSADKGATYARFVLTLFRLPALQLTMFQPWISQHKLFCTWKGERFRVTGASRLGDIWLTRDFNKDIGYDNDGRVDVADCSEWSDIGHTYNPPEPMPKVVPWDTWDT